MNKKVTIELSEAAHLQAEKRAQEKGFDSLGAYVDALIREDAELAIELDPDWLRGQLEEGLASGDGGPLTRETLHQLIAEGVERSKRRT